MNLEFFESGHIYRVDGKVVPSVTQILEPLNNFDNVPPHVLETAAERGKAVHRLCEYHDYGQEVDVPWELSGYLDAWIAFLAGTGCEVELIELRLYHEAMGYAGTLDRLLRHPKGKRVLGDIKATYDHVPTVGPQTAAYEWLWNSNNEDDHIDERWSIRLMKDGKFDLVPLKERSDFSIFTSALNISNWRAKHYG